MRLTLAPALQIQRDLLDIPRGIERFDAYVAAMIDRETEAVKLPLGVFNPMSKEHVADLLDALIAIDGEQIARDLISDAMERLPGNDREIQVCMVVADDAQGGWTNRFITDFEYRYTDQGVIPGWLQVLLWSSEGADTEHVRGTVARAIYRDVYSKTRGIPRTLREILHVEGSAARFAHAPERTLPPEDLEYTIEAIAEYLDADARPTVMACLYGDEAARVIGYEALGFSPWAGFAVAEAFVATDRR